jgi:hypothetical protein
VQYNPPNLIKTLLSNKINQQFAQGQGAYENASPQSLPTMNQSAGHVQPQMYNVQGGSMSHNIGASSHSVQSSSNSQGYQSTMHPSLPQTNVQYQRPPTPQQNTEIPSPNPAMVPINNTVQQHNIMPNNMPTQQGGYTFNQSQNLNQMNHQQMPAQINYANQPVQNLVYPNASNSPIPQMVQQQMPAQGFVGQHHQFNQSGLVNNSYQQGLMFNSQQNQYVPQQCSSSVNGHHTINTGIMDSAQMKTDSFQNQFHQFTQDSSQHEQKSK